MATALAKHEGMQLKMPKAYARYFDAYYDGDTFLFAREVESAVERELELCPCQI